MNVMIILEVCAAVNIQANSRRLLQQYCTAHSLDDGSTYCSAAELDYIVLRQMCPTRCQGSVYHYSK